VRLAPIAGVALALASAAGCAPNHGTAFPPAFAAAQRAETAGRFLEAASDYEAAAKVATRSRDRDEASYLAGLLWIRGGNRRDGVARLDSIANAATPVEHSAEAAYLAANERIAAGDDVRGWSGVADVVTRFPNSGVAHIALRRVLERKDATDGVPASLVYLRALATGPVGSSEVGEMVSFQIAEHLATSGDATGARDQFLATATRWAYPFGAFWDDSLWRASEIDEALGRYPEAVADLDRMLRERETTTLVGSYQRPRMSPALFRIGVLYATRLHDRPRARDAFHRLYVEFTTSSLRARAAWMEAKLWREDGDEAKACDRLSTLVGDNPDSRYVPCAMESCTAIKRPAKSGAPTACHAYLARDDGTAAAP
jgi:tetratricopeptide (TPR) repeat protein